MRFYTASELGPKRAMTPEGFLVCLDVPIARTGEMLYAPLEIPDITPGPDGLIRVQRDDEEVFADAAMASFLGKPTTNEHPPEFVTPSNYRTFSTGSVQNVRRGTGYQADLLLADLIFTTPDAIAAIMGGKAKISCGYDAEYEEIEPGVARQVEIRGNHVALVDDGRCGSRCAIGDSAPSSLKGSYSMKDKRLAPSRAIFRDDAQNANPTDSIIATASGRLSQFYLTEKDGLVTFWQKGGTATSDHLKVGTPAARRYRANTDSNGGKIDRMNDAARQLWGRA